MKYYVMMQGKDLAEVFDEDTVGDGVADGFRTLLITEDLQEAVAARAVMASNHGLAKLVSMQRPQE